MNITKELLEKGVIIKQNGKMRVGQRRRDGEEFVKFSEKGVESEIKNSRTETFAQLAVKATLVIFYLLELGDNYKNVILGRGEAI